jgi:hypothetical protein
MILRLLCIWLVFYSLLSSLILNNLKHELLNRLRSTMAANVLRNGFPGVRLKLQVLSYFFYLFAGSDMIYESNLKERTIKKLLCSFSY